MVPFQVFVAVAVVCAAIALIVRQLAAARTAADANRFAAEIIDNAGEGIVVYDPELRYLLWNRFMEEMTGLPA